jgi:Coenzyme PQQ synthesis protein D (PqqD)
MSTFLQSNGLQASLNGDQLLIADSAGQEITVLNRTAAMVFSMCDGLHTVEAMTGVLAEIYPDDPPHLLTKDVEECLAELREKQLIRA